MTAEELQRAKDQLKGSLMLSLESSTARMSNLARQETLLRSLLFHGRDHRPGRIRDHGAGNQLAQEYFRTDSIAVTVLGNLNGLKINRGSLGC